MKISSLYPYATRRTLRLAAFFVAATLPASFLLPGCGGGGSGDGPNTSLQAGGQVNFGNGQLGNLGFGVLSNNTVFGSFDISNGPGAVTGTPFPVGNFAVSGNRRGNRLNLAGTISGGSLISIDAVLEPGTTAGSFTVRLRDQSFTGTLVSATPTPTTPPTPRPTATARPTATVRPTATTRPTATATPVRTPAG